MAGSEPAIAHTDAGTCRLLATPAGTALGVSYSANEHRPFPAGSSMGAPGIETRIWHARGTRRVTWPFSPDGRLRDSDRAANG
jgi:hypothetical protein